MKKQPKELRTRRKPLLRTLVSRVSAWLDTNVATAAPPTLSTMLTSFIKSGYPSNELLAAAAARLTQAELTAFTAKEASMLLAALSRAGFLPTRASVINVCNLVRPAATRSPFCLAEYRSTGQVWQTLNIGKSPRVPHSLIISGAVHGQILEHRLGVVCQTLAVLRHTALERSRTPCDCN